MITRVKLFFIRRKIVEKSPTVHPTPQHLVAEISEVAQTNFVSFSVKDQALFAKRLAFLIQAGVSIHESIVIISNQTKSKRLRKIFESINADVAAGQFLFKSLERYKKLFGEFTINIIRVGENAGVLAENLAYLAEELSKKQALKRKIHSALIYPILISIATFSVTGMLVIFIFPKIMPIFISLDVALPFTTRALLAVSAYLSHWGFLTIFGLIATAAIFEISRRTYAPLRFAIDWFSLRLPIAGSIARSYNCANFCRTVRLNIKSGITLSEALFITADVTKNTLYKEAYRDFAEHVLKGEKISTTMLNYPKIFPDILPHMILIGETTGNLSHTLGYLSDLYEAEVEESTKNLSNSIEPILLMVMGVLVGIIAVSVISPIYEVTKYIGNSQ